MKVLGHVHSVTGGRHLTESDGRPVSIQLRCRSLDYFVATFIYSNNKMLVWLMWNNACLLLLFQQYGLALSYSLDKFSTLFLLHLTQPILLFSVTGKGQRLRNDNIAVVWKFFKLFYMSKPKEGVESVNFGHFSNLGSWPSHLFRLNLTLNHSGHFWYFRIWTKCVFIFMDYIWNIIKKKIKHTKLCCH